jgi:hypothetical protein
MCRLIIDQQPQSSSLLWCGRSLFISLSLLCSTNLRGKGVENDRYQSQPGVVLLDNLDPTQLRVPITVSWQMTTSRLSPSGTTTISQTYRETWLIEVGSSGGVDLKSPRGRRPIFIPGGLKTRFEIPKGFVIEERDLASLVGIGPKIERRAGEDGEMLLSYPRLPIFINLARPPRGGTDLSISLSDEEHHEVHLDFGSGVGL